MATRSRRSGGSGLNPATLYLLPISRLKEELQQRGLDASNGSKDELAMRLEDHLKLSGNCYYQPFDPSPSPSIHANEHQPRKNTKRKLAASADAENQQPSKIDFQDGDELPKPITTSIVPVPFKWAAAKPSADDTKLSELTTISTPKEAEMTTITQEENKDQADLLVEKQKLVITVKDQADLLIEKQKFVTTESTATPKQEQQQLPKEKTKKLATKLSEPTAISTPRETETSTIQKKDKDKTDSLVKKQKLVITESTATPKSVLNTSEEKTKKLSTKRQSIKRAIQQNEKNKTDLLVKKQKLLTTEATTTPKSGLPTPKSVNTSEEKTKKLNTKQQPIKQAISSSGSNILDDILDQQEKLFAKKSSLETSPSALHEISPPPPPPKCAVISQFQQFCGKTSLPETSLSEMPPPLPPPKCITSTIERITPKASPDISIQDKKSFERNAEKQSELPESSFNNVTTTNVTAAPIDIGDVLSQSRQIADKTPPSETSSLSAIHEIPPPPPPPKFTVLPQPQQFSSKTPSSETSPSISTLHEIPPPPPPPPKCPVLSQLQQTCGNTTSLETPLSEMPPPPPPPKCITSTIERITPRASPEIPIQDEKSFEHNAEEQSELIETELDRHDEQIQNMETDVMSIKTSSTKTYSTTISSADDEEMLDEEEFDVEELDFDEDDDDEEDEATLENNKTERDQNVLELEQQQGVDNQEQADEVDDGTPAELRVLLKDPKALLHRASDVLRKKFGATDASEAETKAHYEQVPLSAEELKQEEDEEYRQLPDPDQFYGEPVPDDMDDDLFEIAAGLPLRNKNRDNEPKPIEEEPLPNEEQIELDYYNSDLNMKASTSNKWLIEPDNADGFALMWGAVRSNYGLVVPEQRDDMPPVAFQVKISELLTLKHLPFEEPDPHDIRIGWSRAGTSNMLGESQCSFAFNSMANKATGNIFSDYGEPFGLGDVITTVLDINCGEIRYFKNGQSLGPAFTDIQFNTGDIYFVHIATKNCKLLVNFGVELPESLPQEQSSKESDLWSMPADEIPEGTKWIGSIDIRMMSRSRRPLSEKSLCTIIAMVGLSGVGKTTWVRQYLKEHPEENWVLLNTDTILQAMAVNGVPRQRVHQGRWDMVMGLTAKALTRSLQMACRRRHNYILDQTNVSQEARKKKLTQFQDFQRKCVVIIPSEDEHERRLMRQAREQGGIGQMPAEAMLEMKGSFSIPSTDCEPIEDVIFVEPPIERINEAFEQVLRYNEEGRPWIRQQQQRRNGGTRGPQPVISDHSNLPFVGVTRIGV